VKRTLTALAVVALTSVAAVGTASATTLTVTQPCGCPGPVQSQEVGVPSGSPGFDNGSWKPGTGVKAGRIVTFE
jgi:hypothetical protein